MTRRHFIALGDRFLGPTGWTTGIDHALRFDTGAAAADGLADFRRSQPMLMGGDVRIVDHEWGEAPNWREPLTEYDPFHVPGPR